MNNNPQPMLWWVYDSESNSLASLPTGPFLAPALVLYGLLLLLRSATQEHHTYESVAGPIAETEYWQTRKKRYDKLVQKSVELNNRLEFADSNELQKLQEYLRNPHGL